MLLYPGATATGGQIPSFVPWAVSEVGMGFLGIPTGAAVNMYHKSLTRIKCSQHWVSGWPTVLLVTPIAFQGTRSTCRS